MAYVETQGYGSRLIESIRGVLFGIVMVVVSFPLLFWNEGRAVQTAKSLEEGATSVVSVTRVDPANEGKLVHFTGQAVTSEVLGDPQFGVSAPALRMRRDVEMYQWNEKSESRENVGGSKTTVYTYDQRWSPSVVRSSGFRESGHDNPSQMCAPELDTAAAHVKLGDFDLAQDIVLHHVDKWQPLHADAARASAAERGHVKQDGEGLYLGQDPARPAVGDCRISYKNVPSPLTMSIVAAQSGSGFSPYATRAGDAILLTAMEAKDAGSMFKTAQDDNVTLTWVLRFVGWFLMTMGGFLVLRPIAMLVNFVPFAGSAVSFGAFVLVAVGSFALSVTTIAVAWVFYRPVLGVGLLVLAAAGAAGAITLMSKAKKGRTR